MAEPKTRPTKASVTRFLDGIEDEDRRRDCKTLVRMMKAATGEPPTMWGTAIIGFGSQPLAYASGRTQDWPLIAFSPRKRDLTLYLGAGLGERALLAKLGKFKASKACLYVKRLSDVDLGVLEALIAAAIRTADAEA
jgi:hypothetical protein